MRLTERRLRARSRLAHDGAAWIASCPVDARGGSAVPRARLAPLVPGSGLVLSLVVAEYDIVLRGGRVIDPESGLDAVCDVAIGGDRVAAVGTGLPPGWQEADVTGQVVTAFIDLHSHAHDLGGARLQVTNEVTTALELEAGVTPAAAAYAAAAAAGWPLNYGFAASWALARVDVLSA